MSRVGQGLFQAREYTEDEVAALGAETREEAQEDLVAYVVAHLQHEMLGILDYGSNVLRSQFIEDLTFSPNVNEAQIAAAMPPRVSRRDRSGTGSVVPMATEDPVPNQVHVRPGSVSFARRGGLQDQWALEFTLDTSPGGCLVTVSACLPGNEPTAEVELVAPGPYVLTQPSRGYRFSARVDAEVLRSALESDRGGTDAMRKLGKAKVGDPGVLLLLAVEPLGEGGAHERGEFVPKDPSGGLVELTYVAVELGREGLGSVQVVGQRMRDPEGALYDLADFYGGAEAHDAGFGMDGEGDEEEEEGDDDESECVVCMTSEPDTACVPCRHLCLCRACAQQLRHQTTKCPICRSPISCLVAIGPLASPSDPAAEGEAAATPAAATPAAAAG